LPPDLGMPKVIFLLTVMVTGSAVGLLAHAWEQFTDMKPIFFSHSPKSAQLEHCGL